MRILIIEDEIKLAEIIASRLKKEKYAIDIFTDGEEGLESALTNIYDLIILDVMLPIKNGFEVLKDIRKNKIKSKVIMLTAKGELEDKLTGFNNGANDYLTKPFHIDELIARVNVQLRNPNQEKMEDFIETGDLRLDLKTTTLTCIDTKESIDMMCKEFLLLECFMRNKGQTLSREKIYEKVWGFESDAESNNLEAYISFIRKKIKIIGSSAKIKAVRGLGYKLEVIE